MNAMMGNMMQSFGGPFGGGPFGGGGQFGPMGMMMGNMGSGFPGGGSFQCQTMSFSSSYGADGQVHTEQFSSSTVGDARQGIRETQEEYSNNRTGVERLALTRQRGDQRQKVGKERCHSSGQERQIQMLHNIPEDQADQWNEQWKQEVAPQLPAHSLSQRMLTNSGRGHPSSSSRGTRDAGTHADAQHSRRSPARGSSEACQDEYYADPPNDVSEPRGEPRWQSGYAESSSSSSGAWQDRPSMGSRGTHRANPY